MRASKGIVAYLPRLDLIQRLSHRTIDLPLILLLAVIIGFGAPALYSAVEGNVDRLEGHIAHLAIALVALLAASQIEPRWIFWYTPFVYLGCLLLLVATLIWGLEANNSQRWLGIPGVFRFQPSELLKVVVPLGVAWYLSHRPYPLQLLDLLVACAIIGVPCSLVYMQPDLGTSAMIALSSGGMVLVAGIRIWWLVVGGISALALSPLAWIYLLHDYQRQRVKTLFNPEEDLLSSGWNIIQSKIAIGSGGLHGKGLMQGTQSRLDFLPESHTDFILAVIGEEWGFIVTVLILLAYFAVLARCLYLATIANSVYARLAVTGIASVFFCNVIVNVGMVLGLLPVVGVPLPLISYGGSSAVTMLAGFGLIMALSGGRNR